MVCGLPTNILIVYVFTLQVVVICMIISFILKQDSVSKEYEQMYGKSMDFWDVQERIGKS